MTDYTELKRLAEAVNQAYADLCEHGGDELAEAWHAAELAYDDAANPDVVMSLIATIDVLRSDIESRCEWINEASAEIDRLQSIETERDQLRAEVAGLKTGYQAYERVNAELKAEVDSLTREADRQYTTIEAYRKDAERYQWLLKNASVILDKKAAYQAVTGFIKFDTMPARTETESAIDAAMGKGEQS